jgi:predicted NAD/FAD-dependent oxidoreductase
VIGAGLSGLAAARGFLQMGASVSVFEKARAPGGRISTRRADAFAFDHGAQYFTCHDPRFAEILEPMRRSGVVAPWPGRIRSLHRGRASRLREETERLVGVPGMSALSRALAADLEVVAPLQIDAVEQSEGVWRLRPADGEPVGPFDAVVVATPAPQAAPLVEAAPRLHDAVAAVRMQPCWAALVAFAAPLDVELDGAFVEDSPLAWVARNNSKPDRPAAECWVLHANPAWSEAQLEMEPEAVGTRLVDALAEALDRELPAPAWLRAHRWRYASTDRPLGQPYLWDPTACIGVCGDWGDGGRVERAVLSGDALSRAAYGVS